jgi:hypothetical protein
VNDDEREEIAYVRSPLETTCFLAYLETLGHHVRKCSLDPIAVAGRSVEAKRFLRDAGKFDTEENQKLVIAAMLSLPGPFLQGNVSPITYALDFLDKIENDASSFERQMYAKLDAEEAFSAWYEGYRRILADADVEDRRDRDENESADELVGLAFYPAWEAFGVVLDMFDAMGEPASEATDYAAWLACKFFDAAKREPRPEPPSERQQGGEPA